MIRDRRCCLWQPVGFKDFSVAAGSVASAEQRRPASDDITVVVGIRRNDRRNFDI
jgi:hypothetical protein